MLAVTEQSEIQNSLVVRGKDQIQGHALYNIFMESKKKVHMKSHTLTSASIFPPKQVILLSEMNALTYTAYFKIKKHTPKL